MGASALWNSKGLLMRTSNSPRHTDKPVDPDLLEQAKPGHGVPSQDADAGAQFELSPAEAAREARTSMAGGAAVAGMAAGAAIGAAVAGPVGAVVGSALGSVVGAFGSAAVSGAVMPADEASKEP